MLDHLTRTGYRPQIVLCSPSRRTIDTFDGIRSALPTHPEIVVDDELYGASADTLLARLRTIDDGIDCALVVGHNPGLQELAIRLTMQASRICVHRCSEKFPTATVATLLVRHQVGGARRHGARLEDLFTPRQKGDRAISNCRVPVGPWSSTTRVDHEHDGTPDPFVQMCDGQVRHR